MSSHDPATDTPPADLQLVAPVPRAPVPEKPYEGTPDENAARLGLSRRPFFRWINYGREHNDPLPCGDPPAVLAWYARMQSRGVFRNRPPATVEAACRKTPALPADPASSDLPAPLPPRESPPVPAITAPPSSADPSAGGSSERRTLLFQAEDIERHLERLRINTDKALDKNTVEGDDEARRFLSDRVTLLDKVSLIRGRIQALDEKEGRLIDPTLVREDYASLIPAVLQTWTNQGPRAHRDTQSTLTRAEFLKIWQAILSEVRRDLCRTRFQTPGPAMELEAA